MRQTQNEWLRSRQFANDQQLDEAKQSYNARIVAGAMCTIAMVLFVVLAGKAYYVDHHVAVMLVLAVLAALMLIFAIGMLRAAGDVNRRIATLQAEHLRLRSRLAQY